MTSTEIRSRFLAFFEKRGHAIIPSASLVTADEKGVTNATLFNTAGMQPLVPYLLGTPHPKGTRLANAQKCVRTIDIDDIGDRTHATFFEMLGNWSLGDYFKKEAITWSYEFLTNPIDAPDGDKGLGLDPKRLYVTVFEGDTNAPRDEEAAAIWADIFASHHIEGNRIFYLPAQNNWWEAGDNGPCGPDTEMYYDVKNTYGGKGLTHDEFIKADESRHVVEVWNDVFMQYEKKDGTIVGKLPKPSVDTGAGLERLTMTLQGVDNIYDTDILKPVMDRLSRLSNLHDVTSMRIVADHIKASVFLIADGVVPSNTDRGYVLRKLIRRAVRHADKLGITEDLSSVASVVQDQYALVYPQVSGTNRTHIQHIISEEEAKFRTTLERGMKEFEKGVDAFTLFTSYGFPLELTRELAQEKGVRIDIESFNEQFKKHQELSRVGAEHKFKGGLADAHDPMVIRYHTATHLLHQALHDVLGEDQADQRGSNITAERLRFDFAYGAKMTDEQKKQVERIVNEKIKAGLPVQQILLTREEAEKTGSRHFFGEKYGEEVSIYFIGDTLSTAYSKEFCGGPHVSNTRELAGPHGEWTFKIQKEEASSQGVRRIKAVLS